MAERPEAVHLSLVIHDGEPTGHEPPDDGGGPQVDPVLFSDDQLADELSKDLGADWRCAQPAGSWLHWDERRWAADGVKRVLALSRRTCRRVASGIEKDLHLARKLSSRERIYAAVSLAATDSRHATPVEAFDTDIWKLNTPGGILDLRTGQLLPADKAALMTKLSAAGPEGECPRFRQFLREATGGDVELERYLQRVAGYCATGSVQEQAFFLATGPGGTGKTLFQTLLEFVLADYATTAPMDTFLTATGERHPTELAMFHGRRLVVAGEVRKGRRFDEAKLKAITGGDTITARFMRGDFFSFRPQFKLFLAANRTNLPKLQSPDYAMRRRLQLIPFDHKPAEVDSTLLDKLKAEAGGILKWIAEGAVEWLRLGLRPPKAVIKETDEYFTKQDTIGRWVDERCTLHTRAEATLGMLYDNYQSWCAGEGESPASKRTLSEAIAERDGIEKVRLRRGRDWGFRGIGLESGQAAMDLGRAFRGEPAAVPDQPGEPVPDPAEDWPRE